MTDKRSGRPDTDSGLAVWLKLAGLLIGLTAFGAAIFYLSRFAHHIG